MSFATARARELWARTGLHAWPRAYVLARVGRERAGEAAAAVAAEGDAFAAVVVEREGVSVTLPADSWRSHSLSRAAEGESGPWRVITLDLDLEPDVAGYLAPAAAALAAAGVPIVPQCGHSKDHLLVPEDKLAVALATLEALVAEARHDPIS